MLNILVTGAKGQLALEIKYLSTNYTYNFFFKDKEELDITNKEAIYLFVKKENIDVILNCASYTDVDKAEKEKDLANRVNCLAVKYLAEISKERNIKLIHISTDYIFDGTNYKPYKEEDIAKPTTIYGKTKLASEEILKEINPKNSIVIRTSWLYSSFKDNFVKTILHLAQEKNNLGVVFDQVGTPTYARDLAKVILEILPKIKNNKVEVYHYSNEGVASWYDFAKEIVKIAKIECQINPIETWEYPTPAKRPYYSVLNKREIKERFDIQISFWKDSLKECLKEVNRFKKNICSIS